LPHAPAEDSAADGSDLGSERYRRHVVSR